MIQAGIIGGTGYTGTELLRYLVGHPRVSLSVITSRTEAGTAVTDLFPYLRDLVDVAFSEPDSDALSACDVVFFATPNGTAMNVAPRLLEAGVKVIDLAADFRLKDVAVWEEWYGMSHTAPELVEEAVYGLPEVNRTAIREARLVANPGCYPTAVQLGFLPLVTKGIVDLDGLIADAKSGVSGAGRKASLGNLLCEASENFKAYAVPGHRHLPEIVQGLGAACGKRIGLTFVPHLTPMIRGIHATLYASMREHSSNLQELYESHYREEPFVDVLPAGSHPETRSVRGTNICRIAVHRPRGGATIVVLSIIDNLAKGAAAQAVQNMNIMLGLEEETGLQQVALVP